MVIDYPAFLCRIGIEEAKEIKKDWASMKFIIVLSE